MRWTHEVLPDPVSPTTATRTFPTLSGAVEEPSIQTCEDYFLGRNDVVRNLGHSVRAHVRGARRMGPRGGGDAEADALAREVCRIVHARAGGVGDPP